MSQSLGLILTAYSIATTTIPAIPAKPIGANPVAAEFCSCDPAASVVASASVAEVVPVASEVGTRERVTVLVMVMVEVTVVVVVSPSWARAASGRTRAAKKVVNFILKMVMMMATYSKQPIRV